MQSPAEYTEAEIEVSNTNYAYSYIPLSRSLRIKADAKTDNVVGILHREILKTNSINLVRV